MCAGVLVRMGAERRFAPLLRITRPWRVVDQSVAHGGEDGEGELTQRCRGLAEDWPNVDYADYDAELYFASLRTLILLLYSGSVNWLLRFWTG